MNYIRRIFSVVVVILLSLSTLAFAQSHEHESSGQKTEAQKSFETMKSLAGSWNGRLSVMEHPELENKSGRVTFRVTSMGNALVHEMTGEGRPDDPITMIYLDGDRLLLTHYCDAGNRPRMEGKMAADGKTLEFSFIDLSGSTQYGHMHHAVFTVIDANHHSEDWTYMEPGDKPVHAHMEFERSK